MFIGNSAGIRSLCLLFLHDLLTATAAWTENTRATWNTRSLTRNIIIQLYNKESVSFQTRSSDLFPAKLVYWWGPKRERWCIYCNLDTRHIVCVYIYIFIKTRNNLTGFVQPRGRGFRALQAESRMWSVEAHWLQFIFFCWICQHDNTQYYLDIP